ncbi:hypothetical protein ACJMK2_006452 [Sinanodonta woodiana]|uniref:Uncharacterized protein n=1 Tax=Sinanodonta woodiana TaxID=1069815 RepID=A0ABD3VUU5_SINWO
MVNVGTARNYGRIKWRKHLSDQTEYMENNKGRRLQSTGSREEVALIMSSIPCSSTEELTVVEDNGERGYRHDHKYSARENARNIERERISPSAEKAVTFSKDLDKGDSKIDVITTNRICIPQKE